ncbi:MAG: ABC transporter substrate-binding protein [Gaiellales bacterium]
MTFLFTDIEGSTRLLREVGAGVFGRILVEHDRLVREAVAASGGHVVDTQGDAFFAAFGAAADAVGAALAVQHAMCAHGWPGGAQVRLRMGVHTGQPEWSEGRYLGLDVHLGARIAAAASGGQILMSEATHSALNDILDGIEVRDLGEHPLKDFDLPQHLFQVRTPDMHDEFPPPRTARSGPSAFAGREEELAAAAVESIVKATRRRERRRLGLIAGALLVPVGIAAAAFLTRPHHVTVVPDSVVEVDPQGGAATWDLQLGPTPSRILAAGGRIWVLNQSGQTLTRINAATHGVTTVGLAEPPSDLAVSRGDVWVVNGGPRTITILGGPGLAVLQRLALRGAPDLLDAGNPDIAASSHAVWVSSGAGLAGYSLSGAPRSLIRGVPHGPIAATSSAVWLGGGYGLFGSSQTLERIDPGSGKSVAHVPSGPVDALAVGVGGVWTVDASAGTVRQIDPTTGAVLHTTHIAGVDAIAGNRTAVWASSSDGLLVRLNPRNGQIASRIRIAGRPADIALSNGMLWVIDQPATPVQTGGGLRVTTPVGPIDSPDPAFAFQAGSWQMLYATDLNLLAFADAPGAAGLTLVPSAAATMPKISDHGHTYTFVIRRGYRFAPSGQPVTAGDFRTAIERALKIVPSPVGTFILADIAGARAYQADRTRHVAGIRAHGQRISFTTTDVNPEFLAEVALPLFSAVPPNTSPRTNGSRPIPSAGPYYIKSYVPNREVILARNRYYPGPRSAHLKTITYVISPHSSWQSVASGRADYDPGDPPPPPSVLARVGPGSVGERNGHQQAFVNPSTAPAVDFFALNTTRPLFRHTDVRRAVNYAINRVALAATTGAPGATPTDQYLPSNMPGFPGNGRAYPAVPDLRLARALMRRSGVRLPAHAILYTCSDNSGCRARATLLRRELARIGITLTVRSFVRPVQFQRDNTGRGFDIADEGVTFVIEDPGFLFTAGYGFVRLGPYQPAMVSVDRTIPPNRARSFEAFDLLVARRYAPLAAYAIPNQTDYFSSRVGCQVYQPVFGIDLTQLCLRR